MIKDYSDSPDNNQYIKSDNLDGSYKIINNTEGEVINLNIDTVNDLSSDIQQYAKDRLYLNANISNTEEIILNYDTGTNYLIYFNKSNITKSCKYNNADLGIPRNEVYGYWWIDTVNNKLTPSLNNLKQSNHEYCFFKDTVPDGWEDVTDKYSNRFIRLMSQSLQLDEDDIKSHNHTGTVNLSYSKSIKSNNGRVGSTGKTKGNNGAQPIGGANININLNNNITLNNDGSVSEPYHITLRLGRRL